MYIQKESGLFSGIHRLAHEPTALRASGEDTAVARRASDEIDAETHTSELTLPGVHGNYCGPLHGTPGTPTVDKLDVACKTHDEAYANGYFNIFADARLEASLAKLQLTNLTLRQRFAATIMQIAFIDLAPVSALVTGTRYTAPALGKAIAPFRQIAKVAAAGVSAAATSTGTAVVSGAKTGVQAGAKAIAGGAATVFHKLTPW